MVGDVERNQQSLTAASPEAYELVGLPLDQIDRQTMASVHITGKGRRERVFPSGRRRPRLERRG